ncbi:hypothetical protein Q1695_001380 [Nippostrongylus brasiliensis]|nr:hypothetical protein Q1695_001380 [Nippostrongylus brasiliensis]
MMIFNVPSRKSSDFPAHFGTAVETSISRASLGEEEISTGLPKESILNPAEDTASVFDVAVKVEQEENENVDVTVTAEVEQVGDVTTAVDDTMMIFNVPSRKSSDFPVHFGTAVETSISPDNTAFVFDVAVKVEQEENENVDVTVTAEANRSCGKSQLASEQELWKIKDDLIDLKNVTDALQVSEESRTKATLENARFLEELNSVRAEIEEKSRFIETEMAKIEDLKNECAAFEEQLIAEKLA